MSRICPSMCFPIKGTVGSYPIKSVNSFGERPNITTPESIHSQYRCVRVSIPPANSGCMSQRGTFSTTFASASAFIRSERVCNTDCSSLLTTFRRLPKSRFPYFFAIRPNNKISTLRSVNTFSPLYSFVSMPSVMVRIFISGSLRRNSSAVCEEVKTADLTPCLWNHCSV